MTRYEMKTFQLILKAKGAEAAKALRNREGIIFEKAADEPDEIASRSNETLQAPSRGHSL